MSVPAGWEPNTAVLGSQWAALDPDLTDAAVSVAVAELWALSGRRFGTWTVQLAPFLPARRPWYAVDAYRSAPFGGVAFDGAAGTATQWGPGWAANKTFRLPGPVVSVSEVTLDGQPMDPTWWVADPDGRLIWAAPVERGAGWPVAQNVYAAPPRWTVTYVRGEPVPAEGRVAVARYAVEIAKGMGVAPSDRLPGRARDVTRNGTSITLAAPEEPANAGLTGVPMVDAWLRTVNPHRATSPGGLYAPEMTKHRVLSIVGGGS